jgi:hypothetical protein
VLLHALVMCYKAFVYVLSEPKSVTHAFDLLIGRGLTFGDLMVFSIFRFCGHAYFATWDAIASWPVWPFYFLPLYL